MLYDVDANVKAHWLREFERLLTGKITDYIVSLMCGRRAMRTQKIAENFLSQVCDITGERCQMDDPQNRVQRIQVFLADRFAVWLGNVMGEADKEICKDFEVPVEQKKPKKSSKISKKSLRIRLDEKSATRKTIEKIQKEEDEKKRKEKEEQQLKELEERQNRERKEQQKIEEEQHQKELEEKKRHEKEQQKSELEKKKQKEQEEQRQREQEEQRQKEEQQKQQEEERRLTELEEQRQREQEEQLQREQEEQRQKDLAEQRQRELEEQRQRELEEQRQRELEEQRQRELEEQRQKDEQQKQQEEERRQMELEERRQKEEEQKRQEQQQKQVNDSEGEEFFEAQDTELTEEKGDEAPVDVVAPGDPLDVVKGWIEDTTPIASERQTAINELIENELRKSVKEATPNEEEAIKDVSERASTFVDQLASEAEKIMKRAPTPLRSGSQVAYRIRKSEKGSHFKVKNIREKEMCDRVRLTRKKRVAVLPKSICQRPKSVKPIEIKEWTMWAGDVVDLVEKWSEWIHKTTEETDSGNEGVTKNVYKEWGEFKEITEMRALEYKRNKKFVVETSKTWAEKLRNLYVTN